MSQTAATKLENVLIKEAGYGLWEGALELWWKEVDTGVGLALKYCTLKT